MTTGEWRDDPLLTPLRGDYRDALSADDALPALHPVSIDEWSMPGDPTPDREPGVRDEVPPAARRHRGERGSHEHRNHEGRGQGPAGSRAPNSRTPIPGAPAAPAPPGTRAGAPGAAPAAHSARTTRRRDRSLRQRPPTTGSRSRWWPLFLLVTIGSSAAVALAGLDDSTDPPPEPTGPASSTVSPQAVPSKSIYVYEIAFESPDTPRNTQVLVEDATSSEMRYLPAKRFGVVRPGEEIVGRASGATGTITCRVSLDGVDVASQTGSDGEVDCSGPIDEAIRP